MTGENYLSDANYMYLKMQIIMINAQKICQYKSLEKNTPKNNLTKSTKYSICNIYFDSTIDLNILKD